MNRRAFIRGAAVTTLSAGVMFDGGWTVARDEPKLSAPNDLIWGVNGHPITAYPGIPLDDQLSLVKELGFTQYRINTRGDGSPDQLDRILKAAEKYQIDILPIISPDMDMKAEDASILRKRAYSLGKTMARRFRGRVPVWELSNELENFAIIRGCEMRDNGTQYPCEWGPAGGVHSEEYYGPRWAKVSAVLGGLSEGVNAGDHKAARAMGTAGWGHVGAFDRFVQDGLEWDISVWHDYPTIPEEFLAKLASFKKPIWVTEFNAGGGGEKTSEENGAMLTERIAYYRKMRTQYNVTAAHHYELLDEPYWGDNFEARMGLVSLARSGDGWKIDAIKPAGLAVKQALAGS